MLFNIFVILFILVFAYYQGVQGFFSALLHLGAVVAAGAIAFALWEPVTAVFMTMMPRFAMGVSLVVVFVIVLLIARVLLDKYVSKNMDFSSLTNLLGGGLLGAAAAVLTTGILMIGLLHIQANADGLGLKPYRVNQQTGAVEVNPEGSGLWVPVEIITADFYSMLSTGAFSSSTPLAQLRPNLVKRAYEVRLRPDHTSLAATEKAVKVKTALVQTTPAAGIPDSFMTNLSDAEQKMLETKEHKLVLIELAWKHADSVYDVGPKLRVAPTQIRLATAADGGDKVELAAPFAFGVDSASTNQREFTIISTSLDKTVLIAEDNRVEASNSWAFLIPADRQPQYLTVRHLRLPLDNPQEDKSGEKIAQLLGDTIGDVAIVTTPPGNGGDNGGTQNTAGGMTAADVQLTAELPRETNRNRVITLNLNDDNEIMGGVETLDPPSGPVSSELSVKKLFVPAGQAMVRVKFTRDTARNFLGAAVQADVNAELTIRDANGNPWKPIGTVWLQNAQKKQSVRVNRDELLADIKDLPYAKLASDDTLYIYFLVNKGTKLISLDAGNTMSLDLNRLAVE